jgi:branched-chain amino acid transport system ATP-binding protein
VLSIQDIHTYYGGSYILQGVDLHVPRGSAVALLGRNGMGKTTTIRSIMGFTPPRRGAVLFEERDISGLQPFKVARLGIGLVPSGRQIFPSLSVHENLTMAARKSGNSACWTLERVYARFPSLKARARNRGNLLSGGEQQMLAIGRALMTNPRLLLMDEPSEGLAPIVVQEVTKLIDDLKRDGLAILLVEQNLSMAMRVCDHVFVMSKGRIVYDDDIDSFRTNVEIKERYIGVA